MDDIVACLQPSATFCRRIFGTGAAAVLALLFGETGAETVRARLRTGVIGAANLAEVLAKLSDHGLPTLEAVRAVAILGLEVAPMTEAQAQRSAELRPPTPQGWAVTRRPSLPCPCGRAECAGCDRRSQLGVSVW